ncbi:MAG: nucleotidyltransferase domain-containing protein [Oscillospiraceae bacterium]|nr:nucleotidyltransferase domain-containing protein [Oscillospiraceae bacterium]
MLTHEQIVEAVKKAAPIYGINSAYYFGSYARGEQKEESDLDLLVIFHAPHISLFTVSGLMSDLEEALHTKVDVLKLPLPKDTILKIDKVVKCYGTKG